LVILRILQLISAIVVVGITGFFSYHLMQEDIGVPHEFIALDVIVRVPPPPSSSPPPANHQPPPLQASITILNIFLTFLLCCRSLPPTLVLVTDVLLALLWGIAFVFLARAMGDTTVEKCSPENYGDYTIVCHLYKVLFAFSALGWMFHLVTCWLAFSVKRKGSRHAYAPTGNGGGIGLMRLGGSTGYKPLDGGGPGRG